MTRPIRLARLEAIGMSPLRAALIASLGRLRHRDLTREQRDELVRLSVTARSADMITEAMRSLSHAGCQRRFASKFGVYGYTNRSKGAWMRDALMSVANSREFFDHARHYGWRLP